MRFEFFIGADADLSLKHAKFILNSQRCIEDYPNLHGAFDFIGDDEEEAVECGARIYSMICESECMDKEEASEALQYALFEGHGLNPDLRIISFA